MAEVLRVPDQFFTQRDRPSRDRVVFYRSLSAATKRSRDSAEVRLDWLQDLVSYVEEFVTLPISNFPDFQPDDPAVLSNDEIEGVAEQARRYWNMHNGPVGNMVALLENQGAICTRIELGADSLDSLVEFVHGRPFVMIGTDKGTAVRWRYDVAHELGHVLLHGAVDKREVYRSERFKLHEAQAHRFAGAFLLPADTFAEDVFAVSLDAFRAIKPQWKTSIAVMIKRVRDLDMISDEAERRLWINYSRRGWRKHEPYDDALEIERPRLLGSACDLLMTQRVQTPEDIVARLGLSLDDVERLAGLPSGYFERDFPVVRLGGPRTESERDLPAEVVPMIRRR
jgi:Zn-dependent peptidase ImmA (M78 family)